MGIEHPDITAALRTGYPRGYTYEEDDGYYDEEDWAWEED